MRTPDAHEPNDADLRDWADSGGAWLTGRFDGPPLGAPAALVRLVRESFDRLLADTATWSDTSTWPTAIDPLALLGERAALQHLERRGARSCGGSSWLVECRDGWAAATLSRPDDLDLVPAWLGGLHLEPPGIVTDDAGSWSGGFRQRSVAEVVERGAELGLAVTGLGEQASTEPVRTDHRRPGSPRARPPRIVDLTSLWAGPLCTGLLAAAGAEVVKVESTRRPDGLRRDTSGWFDLLNVDKRSVALDLTGDEGIGVLLELIDGADIVVESSRPRALRQLGIDAERIVGRRRLTVWASITAHGRDGGSAMRIGFGDDAAVAGGLVAWDRDGQPCFLGDAIADPLTGIVAAAAIASAWRHGGSGILDVAMSRVAATAAVGAPRPSLELDPSTVRRPRHRPVTASAAPLGRHTADVLVELRSGAWA